MLGLVVIVALWWFVGGGSIAVTGGGGWGTGPGPAVGSQTDEGSAGEPAGASMTVTYVHDGDTLYLDPGTGGDELKVRLIGIDTPEIGEHAECFGAEARDRTRALLPEGTVVTVVTEAGPLDQYGRSLLHVYLADGTHVNRVLIDEGFAWAMFFDPNRAFEGEFRDAERAAEAAGVGLWGSC